MNWIRHRGRSMTAMKLAMAIPAAALCNAMAVRSRRRMRICSVLIRARRVCLGVVRGEGGWERMLLGGESFGVRSVAEEGWLDSDLVSAICEMGGRGSSVAVAVIIGVSLSSASMTLSSNPFTSRFRRQGSTPIWKIRNRRTLTPINPHVPHVLIRRILSLQICSSWYRASMLALSFVAASSACRSADTRYSWAADSACSLA